MARHVAMGAGFDSAVHTWGELGRPVQAPGPGLIRNEVDRTQVDLIRHDGPLTVTRSPEHVARTAEPLHIVVFQRSGTSVLRPADGRAPLDLTPGLAAYWTSALAYRWDFPEHSEILVARVPFAVLEVQPAVLAPLVGEVFDASGGYASHVVSFASAALAEPGGGDGARGRRVVGDVVRLVTTVLLDRLGSFEPARDSDAAFQRVTELLADALGEAVELPAVAAAAGLSPRHLQRLFQERGTSFSAWLRLRRLESARLRLADPAAADETIARIATAHGFADQAHFTRAFRSTFGETPGAWRDRARG